jgi:hypothetical protein
MKYTSILSLLLVGYQLHIRRICGVDNWFYFTVGTEDVNFNAFYKSEHFGLSNKWETHALSLYLEMYKF